MILLMTNPLRSAANSEQLERAFAGLDFLVAVDFYINETTRHAHLILPTPSPAEQAGYEVGLYLLSVRNVAKWSWAGGAAAAGRPETWQVLSKHRRAPDGPRRQLPAQAVDDFVFRTLRRGRGRRHAPLGGAHAWTRCSRRSTAASARSASSTCCCASARTATASAAGPTASRSRSCSEAPHGIDLGPLEPRLAEVINTESGAIELAPPTMIERPRRGCARAWRRRAGELRADRPPRHALQQLVHAQPARAGEGPRPLHAAGLARRTPSRIGLAHGGAARVTSRVGSIVAPVEVTDDLMPGVVSLPHGWGHDVDGRAAARRERAPGREHQRAHRRPGLRRGERHRGAVRHAGPRRARPERGRSLRS